MCVSFTTRLRLLAVVGTLFVTGCGSPDRPEILNWYTTTDALPTFEGQIQLNQNSGKGTAILVVEAQFPGELLWVKSEPGELYQQKRVDFEIITSDGQAFPAISRAVGGEWGYGDAFTASPSDANSIVKVAFVVHERLLQQGPVKLQYREVPAVVLPPDKQSPGPPR